MNGRDDGSNGDDRGQRSSNAPHIPIEILSELPSQRRYPVVLDTSVLIADALRRSGTPFTALTFLAQHHFISIVAPHHVEEEVLRKLPKAATDTKRDPARVLATLESVHLPLIHFVDLPPDLPEDSGVMQVADRDRTDAPLAHLTTLLSPCLVLSMDKDLMDSGYGNDGWLADVLLLGELAELDSMVWGGGMLAYLSVAAPSYGLWKLVSLLARSKGGLGLAAAVAIGGAIWFRPQLRAAADRASAQAMPVIEDAVRGAATVLDRRADIEAAYRSRLALPSTPPTLESTAARHLVSRGRAISSDLMHTELTRQGHDVSLHQLQSLLRAHPAFVGVRGKGYQFGELSERARHPDAAVLSVEGREVTRDNSS